MMKAVVALGALTAALVFAASTAAVLITISGSITASDPTQTGRLSRSGVTSSCASAKSNPGLAVATGARHYDSYTFTNNTGAAVCVKVTLSVTSGPSTGSLFPVAYLGSFDPANPTTNYLADPGFSIAPLMGNLPFSFVVPAGQTAVIVVHEVDPDGCVCDYTLTIGAPPTGVTINQAAGQADPTSGSPIHFTVVFDVPVADFATGDVTLTGTAGATTATVTQLIPNDGTTYDVAVSGMTTSGTVIAHIQPGVAHDGGNNPNSASTSTDNTVTYTAPSAVTFASASASRTTKGVLVRWRTGTEIDLLGFDVYRSQSHSWQRLTHSPIAANGSVSGAAYRFLDRTARRGVSYRYRIRAVNRDGTTAWFGPVRAA